VQESFYLKCKIEALCLFFVVEIYKTIRFKNDIIIYINKGGKKMKTIYIGQKVMLDQDENIITIKFINPASKEITVAKEEVYDVIKTEFDNREAEFNELLRSNKKLNKKMNFTYDRSDLVEIQKILNL